MKRLLDWLKPKHVEIPEIKPVLLEDVSPANPPKTTIDEQLRQERGRMAVEIDRYRETSSDIRLSLARNTLNRRVARGPL